MPLLHDSVSRVSVIFESGSATVQNSTPPGAQTIDRKLLLLFNSEIYVLDSVRSGVGSRTAESGAYGRLLKPALDAFSLAHHYVATTSRDSIAEFSASLKAKETPILVIIAGGDTSVGEFVNGLRSSEKGEINVATLPEGTGNALTLSNGSKDETEAVWKIFMAPTSRKVPFQLYQANFPSGSVICHPDGYEEEVLKIFFTVVASWAFHASLVADSDSDEMRKHGIDRFKIAAAANLARPQIYKGDVEIRSEEGVRKRLDGPLAYFVVTPAQRFEPAFVILPKGDIHSSNLYVVGFPTESNDSYIMDIMKQVYDNGLHVENPKVFYQEVSEGESVYLSLADLPPEERRFCVDGAIVIVPGAKSAVEIKYHGNHVGDWALYLV